MVRLFFPGIGYISRYVVVSQKRRISTDDPHCSYKEVTFPCDDLTLYSL